MLEILKAALMKSDSSEFGTSLLGVRMFSFIYLARITEIFNSAEIFERNQYWMGLSQENKVTFSRRAPSVYLFMHS